MPFLTWSACLCCTTNVQNIRIWGILIEDSQTFLWRAVLVQAKWALHHSNGATVWSFPAFYKVCVRSTSRIFFSRPKTHARAHTHGLLHVSSQGRLFIIWLFLQTSCFFQLWHPFSIISWRGISSYSLKIYRCPFRERKCYKISYDGPGSLTKTLEELVDASLLTPWKRVQILLCSHLKQTWKCTQIPQHVSYQLQLKEHQRLIQPQYLWGPACADPSPGWSSWTSGSPWTPPRTSASFWRWRLCGRPRVERKRRGEKRWGWRRRGWARWGRWEIRRPALLRPGRGSNDQLSPHRSAQRPRIWPCWGSCSLVGEEKTQ